MIKIRKATKQDRETLCNIDVLAIRELGKIHYSEIELNTWLKNLSPARYQHSIANLHTIVAELDSKIIGFAVLNQITGKITAIYVEPQYARQGVGTKILKALISESRKLGLNSLHCDASLSAAEFYKSIGFQAGEKCKHKFSNGIEIDCIPMIKIIR